MIKYKISYPIHSIFKNKAKIAIGIIEATDKIKSDQITNYINEKGGVENITYNHPEWINDERDSLKMLSTLFDSS